MPYPNEHSARIESPGKYIRFRRENDKFGSGIDAIWGVKKDQTVELQAIRFDKNKFTVAQAKAWLKEHDYSPISFEAATGKTAERQRLVKHIEDARIEAKYLVDDPGVLEGYAAIFNNVDAMGEIIRPGAFAKTSKEKTAAGKVELMIVHFRDGGDVKDNIGTVEEGKEDNHGWKISAPFLADPMSQDIRAKIKARLDAGKKVGLSIGYNVVSSRPEVIDGKNVTVLEEIIVHEVTVTLRPANEKALVTAAKTMERMIEEIPELREDQDTLDEKASRELSKSSLDTLEDVLGILQSMIAKIEKLHQKSKKESPGPETSQNQDRLHYWKRRMELQCQRLELLK